MKNEHVHRLLMLAQYLEEEVPEQQFDYNHWVGIDWKGDPDLSCGTKACALGWAATMPMFRELGLRIATGKTGSGRPHLQLQTEEGGILIYEPYIIRHLFGSYLGIVDLFVPEWNQIYYTAKEVAAKIRTWVEKNYDLEERRR